MQDTRTQPVPLANQQEPPPNIGKLQKQTAPIRAVGSRVLTTRQALGAFSEKKRKKDFLTCYLASPFVALNPFPHCVLYLCYLSCFKCNVSRPSPLTRMHRWFSTVLLGSQEFVYPFVNLSVSFC